MCKTGNLSSALYVSVQEGPLPIVAENDDWNKNVNFRENKTKRQVNHETQRVKTKHIAVSKEASDVNSRSPVWMSAVLFCCTSTVPILQPYTDFFSRCIGILIVFTHANNKIHRVGQWFLKGHMLLFWWGYIRPPVTKRPQSLVSVRLKLLNTCYKTTPMFSTTLPATM